MRIWECIERSHTWEWEADHIEKEAMALRLEAVALHLEIQASRIRKGVVQEAHLEAH